MKTLLHCLLKIQYQQRRSSFPKSTAGFTMIELLVGTIIAFLITVPLLTFVVDILNRDVKEQAKSNIEQDIQAAMDYIAQDISQAFYIYTPSDVEAISTAAEPAIPTDKGTPKLVFWKRTYKENAVPVNQDSPVNCEDEENENQCNDTFVFSLVAYYETNEYNPIWCQQNPCPSSRITRVEISDDPKYLDGSYVEREGKGRYDPPGNGFSKDNLDLENIQNPENLIRGDLTDGFPRRNVLVNHIEKEGGEGFKVEAPTTPTAENKLAKVTILGNAKSRMPGKFKELSCSSDRTSPYCPTVTAQVGGLGSLGLDKAE